MTFLPRRLIGYAVVAVLPVAVACGGTTDPTPVPAEAAQAPTKVPTATRSPEPSPTSTVAPVPTPIVQPGDSALDEGSLGDLVARLSDDAWDFLVELTEEHSPRESATDEEADAAAFLLDRFEQMGYSAALQPFNFELVADDVEALTVAVRNAPGLPSIPISGSGEGIATGPLVDVGLALARDVPDEGLAGKVAFIQRGGGSFEKKVKRVQEAGAVAAVVYNNRRGLFRGSMITEAAIPVVTVSQKSGDSLAEMMDAGEVEATVSVVIETQGSRNVVAEKLGTAAGTVVLGAHFDTVPDVQGANDNGSGLSVLMTLAQAITDRSFPFTIQIVAFGSAEVGFFGSRFYLSSLSGAQQDDIVAMLNFDVPGSGNFVEIQGDPEMTDRVRNYGDRNGIRIIRGNLQSGGGDHETFAALDITVLFFFADDISRIHSAADTIDFVKPELLGAAVALGIFSLDNLAERQ